MTPRNELTTGGEQTPGSGRVRFSSSSSLFAATPHSFNTLTPSGVAHEPPSIFGSAQRWFTTTHSPQQQQQQAQQQQGQKGLHERFAQAVNRRHEQPRDTMGTGKIPGKTNKASISSSASGTDQGRGEMERGDENGGCGAGGGDGGGGGGEGDDDPQPWLSASDSSTKTATAGSKPRDRSVKRWLSGLKLPVSAIPASFAGRYWELTSPRTGAVEDMEETMGSQAAGLVIEMGNTLGRTTTSNGERRIAMCPRFGLSCPASCTFPFHMR